MNAEDLRYYYEERAAILHFEGGWPKEKAEALARAELETYRKHKEKVAAGRGEE